MSTHTDPFKPLKKVLAEGRVRTREFPGLGTVFTIDPRPVDRLGPASPETRAEVKAARKAEQRKATKELVVAYLVMALLLAFFALGTVVGNTTDADVRDVRIPVPEESAR